MCKEIILAFSPNKIDFKNLSVKLRFVLYYPPYLLCLVSTRVMYQVTRSHSKRLLWRTHEAAFRTVFRMKKGTNRCSKYRVS